MLAVQIIIDRRIKQHWNGECRYTKGRLPIKLVFKGAFATLVEQESLNTLLKDKGIETFI